ncbi:hypothetical protein GUJ93_ZPchr0008g12722 [Zizania palustris]|uniref:Carrier domain-containing protein n=1 Tax=Zizania palustris TaxID=103762 RepID=A0A8J5RXZ9_ZIZPA|nr:hypothetical protein GUJ93_ZPchr0008g12722 [Zizania palustris]
MPDGNHTNCSLSPVEGREMHFFRMQPMPRRFAVCCSVEIVMGLEEEFHISVEESSAQSIATVEDAAALIDKLVAAESPKSQC